MATKKHLCEGDAIPPSKPELLRIYSMRFCPYAQRTRLVLNHKNIPHEVVNINLKNKPDWFQKKTPNATVPVLEIDDKIIYESAICNDYLDEVYPGDKLTPSDPYVKARQRILMELWSEVTGPYYKYLLSTMGTINEEAFKEMYNVLDKYEEALTEKFFGGQKLSMLDFIIWPHLERIYTLDFPEKRFPRLMAYKAAMLKIPAVKETYHSPEYHTKFFDEFKTGKPQYDFEL